MNIEDEYIAFCIDETCDYISNRVKAGEELAWKDETIADAKPTKMSDFYASLGV